MGLDKDVNKLRERIYTAIESSNFEKRLAIDVAAKIRKDGIDPDLAPSTVAYRERVASKKGPKFSASRSSLTLSGQLLGALTTIFQRTRTRAAFYFGVKDAIHKPYKYKKKNGDITKHGGKSRLIDIFDGLMRDRPVTKVFEDKDFLRTTERKLVATIKRLIK